LIRVAGLVPAVIPLILTVKGEAMNEAEIRTELEYAKRMLSGHKIGNILSLAESWLACFQEGKNEAIDSCRLASIVSEESIKDFLKNYAVSYCEMFNHKNKKPFLYCDGCRHDLAHAIAEYVNGRGENV
jgi:hypothetical protein